jgi:hypothetical protein
MAFGAIRKLIGMGGATLETDRARHSRGQQEENALESAGELFELCCICAVEDRPYVLRYRRNRARKFEFVKAIRGEGWAPLLSEDRALSCALTVPFDAFASFQFSCPWCGAKSFVHCPFCDALVCDGRVRNGVFYCRAICSASAPLSGRLTAVTGEDRSGAARAPSELPRPTENKRVLGTGGGLVKR